MNALKFLAVDRSLDSNKEMIGRFQSADLGALPVFGATEDTMPKPASSPPAESSSGATKSHRSMWRVFFGWVGKNQKEASRVDTEAQPELSTFQKAETETTTFPSQGEIRPEAKNRFKLLTGGNLFRRAVKEPIQAEFRFENVRVVCNELHDTDFIIKT